MDQMISMTRNRPRYNDYLPQNNQPIYYPPPQVRTEIYELNILETLFAV